ncbi:FAD-dependent oxidoreductase [Catellatospora sp. NPDC049609]|uniref:NAD(P)/FAD-dependent oxidoreductase n=1 Tax=Catellatospora sp. NPDC049609 TaxID=3155505 RepID=UPI00341A4F42
MRTVDVLVVGAGLAGLHTARLLAERGLDVMVVDRRRSLSAGIRTTGIFVRRTLEDFDLPEHLLGPGVREVLLYPPSRRAPIRLRSDRDEYRVADMAGVYEHARRTAQAAGGLDPCLRLSELAASVAAGYLRTGDEHLLRRYDGNALRARFRGRLLLRRLFAGIRSPAAAEAAVAALRHRAGHALAARILFGDGSFPDVDPRLADLGRYAASAG